MVVSSVVAALPAHHRRPAPGVCTAAGLDLENAPQRAIFQPARRLPRRRPGRWRCGALAVWLCASGWVGGAQAAALDITLLDSAGQPLPDVVALLEPVTGRAPAAKAMSEVAVSQAKRQFQPRVTVVTVGTPVAFPNFDTVRHHIYSISPTKAFEIKLYAGVPSAPVVFDKPGIAVLGCNIHDQMAAWIVVADTPLFALADANGRTRIDALAAGSYRVRLWHAGLRGAPVALPEPLHMGATDQRHTLRLPASPAP